MFRINGAPIFARGANMIPMEEIEGWYSAAAHKAVVQTSAESNINILRVCETCPWLVLNLLALPCASFPLDHLTSESIRVIHFTRYCMSMSCTDVIVCQGAVVFIFRRYGTTRVTHSEFSSSTVR
jgi:hypothetical protein